MAKEYLGNLELMVLLSLIRVGDQAYGVPISREIERRTGRDVALGSVYAALDRLERKGFVSSILGDPTPERGGRSKRLFRLELGYPLSNDPHAKFEIRISVADLTRVFWDEPADVRRSRESTVPSSIFNWP